MTVRKLAWGAGAGLLAAGSLLLAFRLLFVYTWRLGCKTTAATAPAGPDLAPPALTVMSYNVAGHRALLDDQYLEKVAALIRAQHADVVGLQEVHRGTWQARFGDQALELARRTGMNVFYGPSYRALGGEFGNAVLTRGRIVGAEVIALPSVGEPRSALRATIELDGGSVDVFVSHLVAWGTLGGAVRSRQARCLREQIGRSRHPFVVCGDLNAPPEAPAVAELLAGGLLSLCGPASEPTFPFTRRRLDYVLADPTWRVVEAEVLHEGPSDHWPVLARLVRGPATADSSAADSRRPDRDPGPPR